MTIGLYVYKRTKTNNDNYSAEEVKEGENMINENTESKEEKENEKILVHVVGNVKNQGIVTLKNGDRIADAIKAAGGETEEADLNKLNLAYILQDGDKLYVPGKNEGNKIEEEKKEYITTESGKTVITESAGENKEEKEKIVNINKAGTDELVTLSGIGESTANKIISYRKENNGFKTKEEIKKVPGIGDAKYEIIKDKITVK